MSDTGDDRDGAESDGSASDEATAPTLAIREPPVVLVPVKVLEGATLSDALVSFLAPANVVVLG